MEDGRPIRGGRPPIFCGSGLLPGGQQPTWGRDLSLVRLRGFVRFYRRFLPQFAAFRRTVGSALKYLYTNRWGPLRRPPSVGLLWPFPCVTRTPLQRIVPLPRSLHL